MDNSKAKKAVEKSSSRKQLASMEAALMQQEMAKNIDPEIQVMQPDMQPVDGYVNPYHRLGMVPPNLYSSGNILGGYNYPQVMNPET